MTRTLIACLSIVIIAGTAVADDSVVWEQILQRDWLRQAELRYAPGSGKTIACEEDAVGAVNGVIDGTWGFHTENQLNPYWTLDLGDTLNIGRIRLYNRCDACGERNRFLIMSVSPDGRQWEKIWQNDGTMFYGATDGKPLEVAFADKPVAGRFLRLSIEGTSYLHLDEVQVFPPDSDDNIALGKNATQSSTSQWSKRHQHPGDETQVSLISENVFHKVLESGKQLADDLRHKGVDVAEAEAVFEQVKNGPFDTAAYFRLRGAIRKLALSNPLLDFDSVLFAKHAPSTFPHMSDQYYCFWQRGGGAICQIKNIKSGKPELVNLTSDWKNGTYFRPDVSYDGKKVLFAYSQFDPALSDLPNKTDKNAIREESFFHLYEMEIATGKTRQLTFGKYDDFDGRYLPNGDIAFLSTRKGAALQTGVLDVSLMCENHLPNSYVRCGGDNFRPVPVFTLHSIDPDGKTMRQISAFENFEWTPAVMNDGRIAYTRWDYIDRFNGHFFSLWATNPDGTKTSLLYGNYTVRPQVVIEPRAVPDSNKLIFVASAHHSNFGGSLVLLDRKHGTEGDAPIERLTPEVQFPETEGWPSHYYANPWPLSEDYYLVSWSDKQLPPHCRVSNEEENPSNNFGIYYFDRFGNLELLYRDEAISSMNPIPVKSRTVPPMIPSDIEWDGPQEGEFFVQDIYEGLREYGFTPEKQSVRSLRVVAVIPKVQPHMNTPVLSVSAEDTGKFVLGTVPVEPDGSAYFRVPSGMPYFFQALDENGIAVQTMRSLAYLMPNEQATCIGCHETRENSPMAGPTPLAALREPSRIQPDPSGSWPLRFPDLVQPVLNDRCVSCHAPDSREAFASKLDLTPDRAYQSLLTFGNNDLKTQAFEKDQS
ncbi:MAG: discoidin domain-containing protein, partial [Planctomycetaceae bacterium]|nr:discoidin domain-containing protein [Planctomycetaceae bacterium]